MNNENVCEFEKPLYALAVWYFRVLLHPFVSCLGIKYDGAANQYERRKILLAPIDPLFAGDKLGRFSSNPCPAGRSPALWFSSQRVLGTRQMMIMTIVINTYYLLLVVFSRKTFRSSRSFSVLCKSPTVRTVARSWRKKVNEKKKKIDDKKYIFGFRHVRVGAYVERAEVALSRIWHTIIDRKSISLTFLPMSIRQRRNRCVHICQQTVTSMWPTTCNSKSHNLDVTLPTQSHYIILSIGKRGLNWKNHR